MKNKLLFLLFTALALAIVSNTGCTPDKLPAPVNNSSFPEITLPATTPYPTHTPYPTQTHYPTQTPEARSISSGVEYNNYVNQNINIYESAFSEIELLSKQLNNDPQKLQEEEWRKRMADSAEQINQASFNLLSLTPIDEIHKGQNYLKTSAFYYAMAADYLIEGIEHSNPEKIQLFHQSKTIGNIYMEIAKIEFGINQ